MNGADAIVKCLELEGVEEVFGYPGVAICPFYDSILNNYRCSNTKNFQYV